MAYDTIEVAVDAGIAPQHTGDPAEARRLVRRYGAAVLTGAGRSGEAAVAAARAVFAGSARAIPPAAEVRSGGVLDAVAARRPPDQSLQAHTDGFSYGDRYPDHLLLLCEHDSPVGGESFLVDAYRLLDALPATAAGADLAERLERVVLQQTEEGKRPSIAPAVGRAPGGRRMVRRFPEQRPDPASSDLAGDAALVAAWDGMCRLAAAGAPRFHLAPGELLVVDNYRVLHGREPYDDPARCMWRVWVWTDEGYGVPEGVLASDSRNAAALDGPGRWPAITPALSVVPDAVAAPGDGAPLLARDGAVVVDGVASLDAAVEAASALLGDRLVRIAPQFEVSTARHAVDQARLSATAAAGDGRTRRFSAPSDVMDPHNDGYGFGDLAPDHLFLFCEVADPAGGASWVLDGSALLDALAGGPDTAEVAAFCSSVPVDHSEPGWITQPPAPVARALPSGRRQVRHNPYQTVVPGNEAEEAPLLAAWHEAVRTAGDRAERFTLRPGQLLCVDNYRMLHGRDPYTDPARKLTAIWAWTSDAVAFPERRLDLLEGV